MPRIPDRWFDYSITGKQICDTPFIALKCPLHNYFFKKDVPPEKRFCPHDTKTLIPSLSMIIDLTFTNKYYNHKMFDKLGVRYQKIPCVGHEVPNLDVLRRFFLLVDEFLRNRQDGDIGLIGVHCTHGVNRTGFLICSYMINKLGYTFENAVKEFNQARGHEIERKNYLNQLKLYETEPLLFIHNENDIDPKQDFNNGHRAHERVKPRHRHLKRFNNVNSEPIELTSEMNNSHWKPNNELYPNRYQAHFNFSTPRHMPHPNSKPHYNNDGSYNSRRRDYNRNDFRWFNPNVIPPYQNFFNNQYELCPRLPSQFYHHHPPTEFFH